MKISLWKRFKAWRKSKRTKRAVALFHKLMGDHESGIPQMVNALAGQIARQALRTHFDRTGTVHCQLCLRTDQLKRHSKGYACPDHKAVLEEREAVKTVVPGPVSCA
jgi:hypothetical protein